MTTLSGMMKWRPILKTASDINSIRTLSGGIFKYNVIQERTLSMPTRARNSGYLHKLECKSFVTSPSVYQNGTATKSKECILECPFQDSMEPIPKGSVTTHIMKVLEENGEKVALVDGVTGEKLTSNDLLQRAKKVASGLRRRHFGPGDILCIIASNTLHYPTTFLAVSSNGGILTLASPGYNEDELEHLLKNSGATWIVTGEGLEDLAKSVAKRTGNIKEIFTLGPGGDGCVPFQELLEDPGDLYQPYTEVNADKDVAVLPYSSGTTGLPKGVMVTHANLAAAFMQFSDPRTLITSPEDVQMVFLPFFHSLGFIMMFSALFSQYTSVLLPRFTPEVFLKVIEEYKVTFFAAVPPVVLFLSQAPLVDKYDISSLRRMFCAAAPLSADLQDALQKRTGGKLEVRQAYGMTESVAAISVSSGENRIGSVGQISGYMQVKIVDLETQSALGPRKEGEICLRGPQVTPGYYKNQVATAETFDQEGWLRTGDVGYYDEDGFLYIVDRIKELIKYKGMQVAPAELEGLLLQHPEITDAAVVGRPDPRVGELPTAFVAAAPGAQLTQQLVQDYIAVRVSDHKHLRGGVVFLEVIPRTSTGKIARKEVKQLAKELKQ